MTGRKREDELLVVEGAAKSFGGLRALAGVSFRLGRGEIAGIIGPNGSGKSTLFNLMTGIYPPLAGSVWFDGRDITGARRHAIAQAGLVRTFQTPRLFASLTVVQHCIAGLGFPGKRPSWPGLLRQLGTPSQALHSEGLDLLRQVGLEEDWQRPAVSLPYGKRRLLEIARCLAGRPRLLLLDEPTAGLNEPESEALCRLLLDLSERHGLALLVIEHNLGFLCALSQRLIALDQGELLADGSAEAVLSAPRVVEAYLGRS